MEEIRQPFCGDVQLAAAIFPRLEAEVAKLIVERVPRDVDFTVWDGPFEQRPPDARPVTVDPHVVGLRRSTSECLFFRTAPNSNSETVKSSVMGINYFWSSLTTTTF